MRHGTKRLFQLHPRKTTAHLFRRLTGQKMLKFSAAPSTLVIHPSYHPNTHFRKYYVAATAAYAVLQPRKNGRLLAEKNEMTKYKQIEYVSSVSPAFENVFSIVRRSEIGKGTVIAVLDSTETQAARKLCLEQKLYSLLRELVSHRSQPRSLVIDLFVCIFLLTESYWAFFHYWVLVELQVESGVLQSGE